MKLSSFVLGLFAVGNLLFVLLFGLLLLQYAENQTRNVSHFTVGPVFGVSHVVSGEEAPEETGTPQDNNQNMKIEIWNFVFTITGGIISGLMGFLSGYWLSNWQHKIDLERDIKSRRDEFKGLLGRWKSKALNCSQADLAKEHIAYSESMWGYCSRFRDCFSNPENIATLCLAVEAASKDACTNSDKKDAMIKAIKELDAAIV